MLACGVLMALEAGEVALEVGPWMRPEAEGDASDGEVRGSTVRTGSGRTRDGRLAGARAGAPEHYGVRAKHKGAVAARPGPWGPEL